MVRLRSPLYVASLSCVALMGNAHSLDRREDASPTAAADLGPDTVGSPFPEEVTAGAPPAATTEEALATEEAGANEEVPFENNGIPTEEIIPMPGLGEDSSAPVSTAVEPTTIVSAASATLSDVTPEQKGPDSRPRIEIDADSEIMSDCYTLQGNGANWASTLGMLSESFKIRYEKASARQAEIGKPVYILNDCVSGGSSGSAAVSVFNGLMGNKVLIPEIYYIPNLNLGGVNIGVTRVYTVDQFGVIADAMRSLALGSDWAPMDALRFLRANIPELLLPKPSGQFEVLGNLIDRLPTSVPDARLGDILPGFESTAGSNLYNNPPWWEAIQGAYPTEAAFGTVALMANTVTEDDIYVDSAAILDESRTTLGEKLLAKAKSVAKGGVGKILDVLKGDGGIPTPSTVLQKFNKATASKFKDLGDRIFANYTVEDVTFANRISQKLTDRNPFNDYLRTPLRNGMCTVTQMRHYRRKLDMMRSDLPYEAMRPTVFCNAKTIEVIINNKDFQAEIMATDSDFSRYFLAAVPDVFTAFDAAIREPSYFGVLAGRLEEIGITHFYDPQYDFDNKFELMTPFDQVFNDDATIDLAAAVIGGFTETRIQSGIMHFYHGAVHAALAAKHPTSSNLVRYTKPDTFDFARFCIGEFMTSLSGAGDKVKSSLEYEAFTKSVHGALERHYAALSTEESPIVNMQIVTHWDTVDNDDTRAAIMGGPLRSLLLSLPEFLRDKLLPRLVSLPATISGASVSIIGVAITETRLAYEGTPVETIEGNEEWLAELAAYNGAATEEAQ